MMNVGLAVGGGTGAEAADVFETALRALAAGPVRLTRCHRRFRTYAELAHDRASAAEAAGAAEDDARAYESFLLELAASGCRAVFRTAFNAQSLYLVRERLASVKIEILPASGGELLLVRDQAQGFYCGVNDDPAASPDVLERRCRFDRTTTERVLSFALAEARRRWGASPARLFAVYKFHLLDNRLARWTSDWARAAGVNADLVQPDTMARTIVVGSIRGNTLVVGANEWLDVCHAELLARFGGFAQEERCTRNVFLDERLAGLDEFQTVHGSADDIAGTGTLNPLASMRAAAAVAEAGGASGAVARLEASVASAKRDGLPRRTRDAVAAVLARCAPAGEAR